jgi:multicomponent Na+:H+ antiporter subunit A
MTAHGRGALRRPFEGLAGLAVALAVLAFAGVAASTAWPWAMRIPWVPTLDLTLELRFDGLSTVYGLLAAGVGLLVFAYAAAYLPRHLAHEERQASEARRFWPWMILFMGAMGGLACAQDLILLFVFFDLTAVASYFLIGFDRHRADARGAALMALLVTGGSAVALLLAAALLHHAYGTFSLEQLFGRAQPGGVTTAAALMIAVAALAKSAQVPLHFWLPRAMAAPTPVSAYLHSAAMVAAGVLVIGRVHPLLALNPAVLDVLLIVGFVSIAVGGLLALVQDELKQILAYSTVSQYGYVVMLYGIGTAEATAAAALYVVAHGLAKSALFLTAGAVTEATGETRLSRLGGLVRDRPLLTIASAISAASLTALPATLGFFKDELYFAAAFARHPLVAVLAVLGAALTVAYLGRFWLGIFTGTRRVAARPVPTLLIAPVAILAAVTLAGGISVEPFALLAEGATAATVRAPVDIAPGYHLDARVENVMALGAWTLGAFIIAVQRKTGAIIPVARLGDALGPRRVYGAVLFALNRMSDAAHRAEVRDLRTSLAAVLVPMAVLMAFGFAATPTEGAYAIGPIVAADLPIVVLLVLGVAAALVASRDRGRLQPVLALSVLGFALAGVYALMGAPDVALVAAVIETVVTVVFVTVFARLPRTVIGRAPAPALRVRNIAAGLVASVSAFGVIWAALSRPRLGPSDAAGHIRLTPDAHGGDVVTVILADFRGLDTMVEITVLFVAVIGVASLLRREGRP